MLPKNISLVHNLYRFKIIFRYYGWWYQPTTSHRWSNIKFPAEVNNPLITAYFTCTIILKQIGKLYVPKKCAPHKPTYLLTTVWITKVVPWKDNLKKRELLVLLQISNKNGNDVKKKTNFLNCWVSRCLLLFIWQLSWTMRYVLWCPHFQ